MKVPQLIAVLLFLAGLGFVALKEGTGEASSVAEPQAEEVPRGAPEPEPPLPPERPVFRGAHDGSHVYQGIRCPACERGPMEF